MSTRDGNVADERAGRTLRPPWHLVWRRDGPLVWRSLNGRYAIVVTVLPERSELPSTVYTVRRIDPEMEAAYPEGLGVFVAETYRLSEAQERAEIDAWEQEQGAERHIPEDFPAVEMHRFAMPISRGTTIGALTLEEVDGRLLARVRSKHRGVDDRFEPYILAELDVTRVRR